MSSHGAIAADAMSVRLFAGTLANATLQERIAAHDPPLPRLIKPRLDMCFTGECLRRR